MSTDVSTWPPDIGIEPYYSDDRVVIFNADCRDVLPRLPKVLNDLTHYIFRTMDRT